MIEEILQETFEDQQKQCDNVNFAFEKRIEETSKAKAKLEDHLVKVIEADIGLFESMKLFLKTLVFYAALDHLCWKNFRNESIALIFLALL